MILKIKSGNLIICPNKKVKHQPSECLPYVWLKQNIDSDYYLCDIDGYTIDFRKKTVTSLFMKREYDYESPIDVTVPNLMKTLFRTDRPDDWENRFKLAKKMNIPLFLVFWPSDFPYYKKENLKTPIFIINVKIDDKNQIEYNILEEGGIDTLEAFIKKCRNNYSFKSVKPLSIAKTYMECYLANNTLNPWPGDLDGVIMYRNGEIKALLEFKTHNEATPIEEEEIYKYMDQDVRRFKVLMYLQEQIGKAQNYKPNILFIVWGTMEMHKKIKIQVINNSKVIEELFIDSPITTRNYQVFYNEIINLVSFTTL